MSDHTPTPWEARGAEIQSNDTKEYIAECAMGDIKYDLANAEFIVLACNAHDALVERLFNDKEYAGGHKHICRLLHYGAADPRGVCDCGFEELKAALAKGE